MDRRLWIYEHFHLIFNSNINVKHNKILYIHFKNECKMQLDSNEFNTFKMDDSIHVQMLIVQET
jgi:hypothetical protein